MLANTLFFVFSRTTLVIRNSFSPKFNFLKSWEHAEVHLDTNFIEMENFLLLLMVNKWPNVLRRLKRKYFDKEFGQSNSWIVLEMAFN